MILVNNLPIQSEQIIMTSWYDNDTEKGVIAPRWARRYMLDVGVELGWWLGGEGLLSNTSYLDPKKGSILAAAHPLPQTI